MPKETCTREIADLDQINRCISLLDEVDGSIHKYSEILKLTANDVRLKILFLLSREEFLCVCDLSDILDMSIPAVSQHLRKLKDGGILSSIREGQVIYYKIEDPFDLILEPVFKNLNQNKLLEVLAA